jgi:hypothetical protein
VVILLFRKFLVTLIAIFTFGLIIPDLGIDQKPDEVNPSTIGVEENKATALEEVLNLYPETVTKPEIVERFIANTYVKANELAKTKFGTVIDQKIGASFENEILPKIVETVKKASVNLDVDTIQHLTFTSNPPGGLSERIFNIYDERTGQAILKFHVRRENPPKQGHFFSFHYHTKADSFENHYEIGKIFWDKNTPPKWKKTA